MVKIRLTRTGRKKLAFYRIVAMDSRTFRDGRYIDLLGTYDPNAKKITLDHEKANYWLDHGAQPTDTVRSILSKEGILKQRHEAKRKSK